MEVYAFVQENDGEDGREQRQHMGCERGTVGSDKFDAAVITEVGDD